MATLSLNAIIVGQYVSPKSGRATVSLLDLDLPNVNSILKVTLADTVLSADAAADRTPHKLTLSNFQLRSGETGMYCTADALYGEAPKK